MNNRAREKLTLGRGDHDSPLHPRHPILPQQPFPPFPEWPNKIQDPGNRPCNLLPASGSVGSGSSSSGLNLPRGCESSNLSQGPGILYQVEPASGAVPPRSRDAVGRNAGPSGSFSGQSQILKRLSTTAEDWVGHGEGLGLWQSPPAQSQAGLPLPCPLPRKAPAGDLQPSRRVSLCLFLSISSEGCGDPGQCPGERKVPTWPPQFFFFSLHASFLLSGPGR